MQLSTRIRLARRRAHLSQEALARELGISRGAVANWECSLGALPATSRLERLARITSVNFEWLATGRGSIGYVPVDEDVPAVEAEFVHDPTERRLLAAFRACGTHTRKMLLKLADAQALVVDRRSA
jgi:transcriptional regulator with XRE-family HTH domain